MISRAVVREWKSGLASFSNCRGMKHPCVPRRSPARAPRRPRAASGSRPPPPRRPRKLPPLEAHALGHGEHAAVATAAQTMARPMPVLPLVGSTTVWPGLSSPDCSAASIDRESQTVLDRAQRVEGLDFHVQVEHTPGGEAVDPHDRRVSNRPQYVLKSRHAKSSSFPRGPARVRTNRTPHQPIVVKAFSKAAPRSRR